MSLDLYYLGLHRNDASFAQGTGREHRHTIGARLFGTRTGFDWHEAHDFHRRHRRDNDVNFDWTWKAPSSSALSQTPGSARG